MNARSLLLLFIWTSWLGVFLALTTSKVAEDQVKNNSGAVRDASCVTSRSVNGLKLEISNSSGQVTEEFINLPGNYECEPNLVAEFLGKQIWLSRYKERTVGLTIGNTTILDVQDGIDRANDKISSIIFSFLLVLIASFLILVRRR